MNGLERIVDTVADGVIFIGSVLGSVITMDKNILEKIMNGQDNKSE